MERVFVAEELWVWDRGSEAVSMAIRRELVSGVYTPPKKRTQGYAEACVHALSKQLRDTGIAASSTLIWGVLRQTRSTDKSAIGRWQTPFATASSDGGTGSTECRNLATPGSLMSFA